MNLQNLFNLSLSYQILLILQEKAQIEKVWAHIVSYSTTEWPLQHGENYGSFPSPIITSLFSPHFSPNSLTKMEIELVKCECCGLKEECTQDYINGVKAKFDGKWLCGLCSEAVRDEVNRGKKQSAVEEAVIAHMSFCGKYRSNPAIRVADGMRQMLRRRSGLDNSSPSPSSSSNKYSRSTTWRWASGFLVQVQFLSSE